MREASLENANKIPSGSATSEAFGCRCPVFPVLCRQHSTAKGPDATGSAVGVRSVTPPSRFCAGRVHCQWRRVLKRLNLARRNFSSPYLVSLFFDYIVHQAGWWDPSDIYDPTPTFFSKMQARVLLTILRAPCHRLPASKSATWDVAVWHWHERTQEAESRREPGPVS